jgi:hypothetical protein
LSTKEIDMSTLTCDHDEQIDGSGTLLSYTDVSSDFGAGAVAISCPCGDWVVEGANGEILAVSSGPVVMVELRRAA